VSALLFHMIDGAPDPVAPFSHAVEADGWVFVTGQMPFTGRANTSQYPESIEEQTHQVMKNLRTVLTGAGTSLDRVAFARVYLVNFQDYAAMNGVYVTYFTAGRLPARTCVGVTGLALGALVEIDLIVKP
jgi:reactive intermediate/imine deaminase